LEVMTTVDRPWSIAVVFVLNLDTKYYLVSSPLDISFQIFVTSSRKVDDYNVILFIFQLIECRKSMGRLNSGNYPFQSTKFNTGFHGILIGYSHKFCPTYVK